MMFEVVCFWQPLMREVLENKVEITKDEARSLIERCLKVLYYRDARSYNRVTHFVLFIKYQKSIIIQNRVQIFDCMYGINTIIPLSWILP